MTNPTITAPPAEQVAPTPRQPLGQVVASGVSADDFMARYAAQHHEWVRGVVIKMSPAALRHVLLVRYLQNLLQACLTLNPIGQVIGDPFVMRIDATESRREPDLQVILNTNPGQLTETYMHGPADLCIEVVSDESTARDYGEKFEEYERGGVREYWIFDPLRAQALFYRRDEAGIYRLQALDDSRTYETALLPGLRLHEPTLWQEPLPDIVAIVDMVRAMLK